MKTTILINVYNAEKHVDIFFESLKKQTFKDFDIIVIDDGSTDNTVKKIYKYRKYFKINVIKIKHCGLIKARSFGEKKVKSDILVISDIDLLLISTSLEKLIDKLFSFKDIAAAGGCIKSIGSNVIADSYGVLRMFFTKLRSRHDNSIDWVNGGFCAFKKDILDSVGGLATDHGSEDLEISWRLQDKGYRIGYAKDAIVFHKDPSNFRDVWRRDINTGNREFFLSRRYIKKFFTIKRCFRFYPFLLPVFLYFFIINPLLISGFVILSFIPFILLLDGSYLTRITAWFTFNVMNFAYCFGFLKALLKVK